MLAINELDADKNGITLYCCYYDNDIVRKFDWDYVIDDCLAVIYNKKTKLNYEKCFDYLYELIDNDPFELVDIAFTYQEHIIDYYERHEEKILF